MFVPEAGILGGLGILLRCGCLAAAAAFPVAALSWCYTRRMTRNQSEGKEKALNRRISELERRKREAQTAHNTIRQALLAGGAVSCLPADLRNCPRSMEEVWQKSRTR